MIQRVYKTIALATTIFLCSLVLHATPTQGLVSCRNQPDFGSPILNQLFGPDTMTEQDCSVYPEDSQIEFDNIDSAAVECFDNPKLVGELIFDEDNLVRQGTNKVWRLAVDDFPNSLRQDQLESNELIKYALTTQDFTDPNYQRAICKVWQITDVTECAKALETATCDSNGNCAPNPFLDHPHRRATPFIELLREAAHRAHFIEDCSKDNRDPDLQCGNVEYTMEQAGAASKLDPNDLVGSYFRLTEHEQNMINALHTPKMIEKFYIYGTKSPNFKTDFGFLNFLGDILSQERVVVRHVPAGKNTLELAILDAKKRLPPGEVDKIVGDILNEHRLHIDETQFTSLDEQIAEKVRLKKLGGLQCEIAPNHPTQLMGGVGFAGPSDYQPLVFSFDFSSLDPRSFVGQAIEDVYELYSIVPVSQKIIEALNGTHPQSPIRSRYAANTTKEFFDQTVNIALTYQGDAQTESDTRATQVQCTDTTGTNAPTESECTCPTDYSPSDDNSVCTLDEDNIAKAVFKRAKPVSGLPGDQAFRDDLHTLNKMYLPNNDKQYFQNNCSYYDNLCAKAPGVCAILNPLASQFNNSSQCAQPPTTISSNNNIAGDICAVAAAHNIPCQYLQAIWEIETGSAENCANLGDSGLMAIVDGTYHGIDNGGLDRCKIPDAFELAARVLEAKQQQIGASSIDISVVGAYHGCYGLGCCVPSAETQCRWGVGVSYCDAVNALIDGSYPHPNWSPNQLYCGQ